MGFHSAISGFGRRAIEHLASNSPRDRPKFNRRRYERGTADLYPIDERKSSEYKLLCPRVVGLAARPRAATSTKACSEHAQLYEAGGRRHRAGWRVSRLAGGPGSAGCAGRQNALRVSLGRFEHVTIVLASLRAIEHVRYGPRRFASDNAGAGYKSSDLVLARSDRREPPVHTGPGPLTSYNGSIHAHSGRGDSSG